MSTVDIEKRAERLHHDCHLLAGFVCDGSKLTERARFHLEIALSYLTAVVEDDHDFVGAFEELVADIYEEHIDGPK